MSHVFSRHDSVGLDTKRPSIGYLALVLKTTMSIVISRVAIKKSGIVDLCETVSVYCTSVTIN